MPCLAGEPGSPNPEHRPDYGLGLASDFGSSCGVGAQQPLEVEAVLRESGIGGRDYREANDTRVSRSMVLTCHLGREAALRRKRMDGWHSLPMYCIWASCSLAVWWRCMNFFFSHGFSSPRLTIWISIFLHHLVMTSGWARLFIRGIR